MPRGDKSKYTDKQERKADHIAEGYEKRGVSEKEAERRAWATVNKDDAGGKKLGGSGRGKHTGNPAAQKGGEKGGEASASRSASRATRAERWRACSRSPPHVSVRAGGRAWSYCVPSGRWCSRARAAASCSGWRVPSIDRRW